MYTILKRRADGARVWTLLGVALVALALAVAGCGGSRSAQGGSAYGGGAPAAPAGNASGAASIGVANSSLGKILVDSHGRTLYLFQADKGSASTCNGACASAWPPVLTHGAPVAGTGLSSMKLGTTKRADGSTEVTYNGHPLYTYVGDSGPGEATGEENQGFGAEWDVLSPSGDKVATD